jgi:hypothetical protein
MKTFLVSKVVLFALERGFSNSTEKNSMGFEPKRAPHDCSFHHTVISRKFFKLHAVHSPHQ